MSLLFLYCVVNAAVARALSRTENIIWCFSAPNGAANVPEGHNLSAFDRLTVSSVSADLGNVPRISKRTIFSLFLTLERPSEAQPDVHECIGTEKRLAASPTADDGLFCYDPPSA